MIKDKGWNEERLVTMKEKFKEMGEQYARTNTIVTERSERDRDQRASERVSV